MRPSAALLAALLLLLAAGCGNKHENTDNAIVATNEGLYVDAQGLKYQVQLSRELNPSLETDRPFLEGLPPQATPPSGKQAWFLILMRVENDTSRPRRSTGSFEIVDTGGITYNPIALDPKNEFAYRAATLAPGDVYPDPDTIPGQISPRQGRALLFKFNLTSYQDRPIELHILSPDGQQVEGTIDLDL